MKRPTISLLLVATVTTITLATISISDQVLSTTITPTIADTKRQHPQQTSIQSEQIPTDQQQQQQQQPPQTSGVAAKGSTEVGGAQRQRQIHQVAKSKRPRNQSNQTTTNTANPKPASVRGSVEQHRSSSTTGSVSLAQQDPYALAQQQARLMMGYNNTPPLFVTDTRDFFVDVARQPLGTIIKTMRALDTEGDRLEYSLQPANIHDASPYFTINPTSGELKLANRQFKFYHDQWRPLAQRKKDQPASEEQLAKVAAAAGADEDEDEDYDDDHQNSGSSSDESDSDEDDGYSGNYSQSDPSNGLTPGGQRSVGRNMYFLNVAVDDGRYTSVVEIQIHVFNSSFAYATGLPVQLTPEGSRKALSDQLEDLIFRKTGEFYDKLHKAPNSDYTNNNNNNNNNNESSPLVVYPNFVNPSLVRPSSIGSISEITTSAPTKQQHTEELTGDPKEPTYGPGPPMQKMPPSDLVMMIDQVNRGSINSISTESPPAELLHDRQQLAEPGPVSQPMLVSLVVACSCLMICLVLLMFIVPLSVKRLRKRLKHVELQHEHLSQRTSNGSSTVCSTSSSSTRDHLPSLSQFTLSSARSSGTGRDGGRSSVCRQSSLDSAEAPMSPPLFGLECSRPLNRINNGSIANPVYLQHQQQQHHLPLSANHQLHHHQRPQIQIQNQAFLLSGSRFQLPSLSQQPATAQRCDNVYYPIDDDDFYSTINTGSTILNSPKGVDENISADQIRDANANNNNYFLTKCSQEPLERPIGSRNSDSGSSTRSLARFLSLPARHSAHSQAHQSNTTDELQDRPCPVDQIFRQITSKTIARASHIERDQQNNSNRNDWELDRHKLKFLDILDAGQFGQVWRCNLKQNTGDLIVAVKTLKNSAVKDERGREELLAEIEIMKLVCHHPNVVKILHCCTSNDSLFGGGGGGNGKPILLVMEYVEMGKLQSYLENSRINHNYATSQQYNNKASQLASDHLTSRDLIKFIYHVAKGMEYISSHWIVHRDLASRNILINSQRICKIGDFGMARHMQSFCGIYERHSRNTKIPVRWMAPEVLLENRFTTKSDVFSFGILMWEIVTLGSTPYRHLKTEQVIEEVARNGERPTKPEYCHTQLYKIMSKCWLHEPDHRPTFGILVSQLDELLLSANDYIELDQYPDHNYYNIPETAAPNELL